METFYELCGYEGEYEITKSGIIKSLKLGVFYGKIRKVRFDKDGYLLVTLSLNGKLITEKIHRLVAKTFILNPFNLPQINHKDGNKINNNNWNLEWCSDAYNKNHSWKIGLHTSRKGTFNRPTKRVLQINIEGELVNEFGSYSEAERLTGIGNECIHMVCSNKRKSAGGYYWRVEKLNKTA